MCGIVGWIGPAEGPAPAAAVRTAARAIGHRGPDGHGFFEARSVDGRTRVLLAHARLAIIDLAGGAQPMEAPDGTAIAFNGEIYNYPELRAQLVTSGERFTTNSDTEVILRGWRNWGETTPKWLRGMFAFALWEPSDGSLFLVRDRFGKKPLFLARCAGGLAFASEIKALTCFPGVEAEIDEDGVALYLAYRFVPGPTTMYRNITKLAPGNALIWKNGEERRWRWYAPPDGQPPDQLPFEGDPIRIALRHLREAVRIRLISDVPVGAFLSGGLDLSAIVALMAETSSLPVRTFSVGFEEAAFSELPYARTVAKAFGCEHSELVLSARDLPQLWEQATHFRDAPVSEPADIPILELSRIAARAVKVVLTGEGSDEIFGGYPKHFVESHVGHYQMLPRWLRRGVIEPLAHRLPYRFHRIQTLFAGLGTADFNERMARWFGAFSADTLKDVTNLPLRLLSDQPEPGNTPLRSILYFDQTVWLPDNLLERGDRMTMAAGLEARNPFMDHVLANFASTLPDDCRVRGTWTKWLLRKAMEDILPKAILQRPKVGFRLPVERWFRGDMRDYVVAMLDDPDAKSRAFLKPAGVRGLLEQHLSARRNHEKAIWALLALEIFLRKQSEPAAGVMPPSLVDAA